MRLIIAEKPSLGRAIAEAHDISFKQQEGYLASPNVIVSWCFGHLLEQAPPDTYNPAFKQWSLEHLPIVPSQWQLIPRSQGRKQLSILRKLLKQSDEVIHAGDPDREGQLLVQETLDYLKWRGPTKRLLVNDMNQRAVKQALSNLQDNTRFMPLFEAAQSRSRADWLYGINLSRAWTLTGQKAGYQGVLSVGRVQTPVLGLIARRDAERENFVPVPFFSLWADFKTKYGVTRAWWKPQDKEALIANKKMDEDGRILDRSLAESIATRIQGTTGRVAELEHTHKRQAAPMPYSLSTLQIDAARRYKLSAQQVLDAAQSLYERHKLITYPRSDCRYLPTSYLSNIGRTITQAVTGDDTMSKWVEQADFRLKSAAFNDSRIGAHHALAPTGKSPAWNQLSVNERNVYQLITRNVVAQFYPRFEFNETDVTFIAPVNTVSSAEYFHARGRQVIVAGWKPLFTMKDNTTELPSMEKGEEAHVVTQDIEDRLTQPPAAFTDASLLNAMTHVSRYVTDANVRKTLRDTDGLGTEATRAGIIETLIQRQFIVRQKGVLRATRTGRALVNALPEDATRPERTAQWEQALSLIGEGQGQSHQFIDQLVNELDRLLSNVDVERMRYAIQQSARLDVPEGASPSTKKARQHRAGSYRKRSTKTSQARKGSKASRQRSSNQ